MFNFYIKNFNFKNKKIENIFKCTLNLCLSSYMHAYKQNLHNKWKGPKLGNIYIYMIKLIIQTSFVQEKFLQIWNALMSRQKKRKKKKEKVFMKENLIH